MFLFSMSVAAACNGLVGFFFNDTATTEIYTYLHTLSLHDALPISRLIASHASTNSSQSRSLARAFLSSGRFIVMVTTWPSRSILRKSAIYTQIGRAHV